MTDDDKGICTLYFDKDGCGPAPLQLELRNLPGAAFDQQCALGLQFKASGLTIIESPAGGGFYFTRRADVERLHAELGEWLAKKFYRVDDDGAYWLVVARDVAHCKDVLRDAGATWETDAGRPVEVDEALSLDLITITEMTPQEVDSRKRCHTEDERGVIPLMNAKLGDAFCSEW